MSIYDEEAKAKAMSEQYGTVAGGRGLIAHEVDYNPTVRENLEKRIAHLEHDLAEAKASREALAPLLDIKIRDIRRAMDY